MKNPQFGVWAKDDEEVSDVQTGEPFDERAAQALELIENLQTETALNLYGSSGNEILRQHITINNRSTPFPLPPTYVYRRALKRKEAEMLLKSAGINFYSIDICYVAEPGAIDYNTAQIIYPKAQCVVAELPAELMIHDKKERLIETIKTSTKVHLFFVWAKERGGWELVKAMVEKRF